MKRLELALLAFACPLLIFAQLHITGHITNNSNQPVEYATVHIDALYTLSDTSGNFSITIPSSIHSNLTATHLSYQPITLPYSAYSHGKVNICLTEKTNNIGEVAITGKKIKKRTIAHKGIKLPGDVKFNNIRTTSYETGPIISNKKEYLVRSINFKVKKCTYTTCTIRAIFYEVNGNTFTPIQHQPIYRLFTNKDSNVTCTVKVDENILLKKNKEYYIGIAIVNSNGNGELAFPAYMHKGYVRNMLTSRAKRLPASLGVEVGGVEIE